MKRIKFNLVLGLMLMPALVLAARPSINELNTRVNQLEAENNAQQSEIDALRTDVDGLLVTLPQICELLTNPAPAYCIKRVFITQGDTDGDIFLGGDIGVTGADAFCQLEADTYSLGGTWKAWISDSTSSPSRTFFRAGKYVDLAGVTIANGWGDLTDGVINVAIDLPAGVGTKRLQVAESVWTGTSVSGGATISHCSSWASGASTGTIGSSSATDSLWTDQDVPGSGIPPADCFDFNRLYCFEQ